MTRETLWMPVAMRGALIALAAAFLLLLSPQRAAASFHLMEIQQVMAGAGGDANIQFVELRLTFPGNQFVGGHKLIFFDGSGARTGTFIFPGNATNGFAGDSILVGTTQFDSAATVLSDFTMVTNLNANDGRLCFTSSTEILIVDCVAYGNFTGDNTGFGGPAAPLPITGNFSLRRGSSTNNNAADFQLGTPAPRNNARQTGQVVPPQPQLVSIAVAPDSPSIQVGETQQVFGHGHLHRRQHEHGYYSDNLGKLGPDGCHNQQRGRK